MSQTRFTPRKVVLPVAVVLGLAGARDASATITVCRSGCAYTSVQAAVDAAPDGEIIRIREGVFVGPVSVSDKNLVLRGSGANYTVIDRGPVAVSPAPPAIELACTGSFQITISDLTITGGVPFEGFGGGGLENDGCQVNLNRTAIMNNVSRGGGGISNSASLLLVSTVVSDNSTWGVGKGGGIENGGTLVVRYSTIANNQGPDGGGLANAVGASARLVDSLVTNNSTSSAYGEGGGLFNVGSVILRGTLVIGNESGSLGGGIFNKVGGSLVLNDSTVTRNSAGSSGGGIYSDGATSVVSSVIVNNVPDNCAGTGHSCP